MLLFECPLQKGVDFTLFVIFDDVHKRSFKCPHFHGNCSIKDFVLGFTWDDRSSSSFKCHHILMYTRREIN